MNTPAISRAHSLVGYNPEGRPEHDFYPTPPEGTLLLFKRESLVGNIWECACGDGSMSRVIEQQGYNVISTDIEPRKFGTQLDFLLSDRLLAPNIITNPPFVLAQEFATHALNLGCEKLALLVKLQFLETQERTTWLETTPLMNVWISKKRLSLYRDGIKMKNGGMIAFCWCVWERGYTGRPRLGWV